MTWRMNICEIASWLMRYDGNTFYVPWGGVLWLCLFPDVRKAFENLILDETFERGLETPSEKYPSSAHLYNLGLSPLTTLFAVSWLRQDLERADRVIERFI